MKRLVSGKWVQRLAGTRDRLNDGFRDVTGIYIEDKGCILAVHYRNADPRYVPLLLMRLKRELKPFEGAFCLGFGKSVFEIRPRIPVNKGFAVLQLLNPFELEGVLSIYMGDDETDEEAFRALRGKGIAIFVGSSGPSSARYYVKDPSEVYRFLDLLNEECTSWWKQILSISSPPPIWLN